ncbi:sugar phosphate isomerase/epimerase family protein [Maribacter antarcticus]|uniref:sugar phosphate isomerase/epimerase family protein n=1 Tax=Maribacter antarcticus TaxID=505250 RepID=UPI000A01A0F3|nr:sugar phosphate isomerase/epimerase [Maribacter antarcticus]
MRIRFLLTCLLFTLPFYSQEKKLECYQTDWGRQISWDAFCEKTKAAGYDGIEVWFPTELQSELDLKRALDQYGLKVIFLTGTNKTLPFEEAFIRYTENLMSLVAFNPIAVNCLTGNDFYPFEQNNSFIDAANKLAKEHNIPIYHETHRGRFSYNLPDTKRYIQVIPDLKLTLDISHWMVVHESLLENEVTELSEVLNHSHHIIARIGHAEGPQVNSPEAPEWKKAVNRYLDIWEIVIRQKWQTQNVFTITTEFGSADHMPTLPYAHVPVADQWKANMYMMKILNVRLNNLIQLRSTLPIINTELIRFMTSRFVFELTGLNSHI